MRKLIFWLSSKPSVTRAIARRGMKYGFAQRFVPGETLEQALDVSREICKAGRRFSLNHLGESVKTQAEAAAAKDSYLRMLREIAAQKLDGNISIKLTQLGLEIDRGLCEQLTAEICAEGDKLSLSVEIDMEQSSVTDATIEIFENMSRRFQGTGMAIQAYLFRTERDLERLAPLHPRIRLVKGAYREPAGIAFQKKSDVDANYWKLVQRLLRGDFFPLIATHDPEILENTRNLLRERKHSPERYEFEMIYGIRRDLQEQTIAAGLPLRVYVPFGDQWCPYFMRRLSERPANCMFVLRSLAAEGFRAKS